MAYCGQADTSSSQLLPPITSWRVAVDRVYYFYTGSARHARILYIAVSLSPRTYRNASLAEQEPIAAVEHASHASTNGLAQKQEQTVQDVTAHQAQEELWWRGLVEFGGHILVATLIFVLIAMAAVGLDFLLRWLEMLRVNNLILDGLTIAKKTVFIVDLLLYITQLVNMSWKFCRSMTWQR
jgi:hypothetical protein